MTKKKITLLWRRFNTLELGKDVVLVPLYLARTLGYEAEIVCGYDEEPISNGVKFVRRNLSYKPWQRMREYVRYLWSHAREIDVMMCFHWRMETWLNIALYKMLHPQGQVYIKLDTEHGYEWDLSRCSAWQRPLRRRLYRWLLNRTAVLSCETSQVYEKLVNNNDFGAQLRNKLTWMPNAFDEAGLQASEVRQRSFAEKENIFLTVGRLGTPQKNTEMLLKAAESLKDWKDWKMVCIGPIEADFKPQIDDFMRQHPTLHNRIVFTGAITEKTILWDYYSRAKVFICTSRWESYGLVLGEARRLGCFLLTTEVGAAKDLCEQAYGKLITQEDSNELKQVMQEIINGTISVDVYKDENERRVTSYEDAVQKLTAFLQ